MASSVFNVVGVFALVFWLVFSYLVVTFVSAATDSSDVSVLNVMFTSMNSPSELDNWKSSGGDPCGDTWVGISCSGSQVTEMDLSGLGLKGSLGYKLSELTSVTYFDLSRNNFNGSIPYQLPPNIQRMDLSDNDFNGNVPYSISQMTDLQTLDLKNNKLNGQLSEMFSNLSKLTQMDLSFNSLSGDLPQSFMNLTSLSTLHLQNNKFTGSINALANLPLNDLNVENNKFTGWIPDELKNINNLQTGGNSWSSGPAPPPPPGVKSTHPARQSDEESSGLSGAAIAGLLFSALLVLALIICVFARHKSSPLPLLFDEEDGYSPQKHLAPLSSRQLSNNSHFESRMDMRGQRSFNPSSSFNAKPSVSSSSIRLKAPSLDHHKSLSSKDLARRSGPIHVAPYSLADLQNATNDFSTDRNLGEGSIGCVYRAKYDDGQVLALKMVDHSLFQGEQQTEFIQVVSHISKLRHSNICELVGYCSEQGHHILVYDYFRNGSLHEFLHLSDDFSKPLTWNTRVKIALGTARAIEYLHEVFSPPCVHKNIKSSNVLLDAELNPHLSDCGLAKFHERRRHKQVENGYNAPECSDAYGYSQKSDVYSFGVVMLELMTGQMPFDSRKAKYEQSLVRWASPQLHDKDALDRMADPGLHGLYPPRVLSQFADVIALCLQAEAEFRPPISQVVHSLVRLVEATNMYQAGEDLRSSRRTDDGFDY